MLIPLTTFWTYDFGWKKASFEIAFLDLATE